MGDIKIPTPDRRTWAIIILMVAVALQPNAVGYVDPTGGLQDLSFEPKQPRFDFTRALKLAVVPLSINFRDLTTPFWKLKQYQQNPLRRAYACADQFGPSLKTASRVAFFYQQPRFIAWNTFQGAPDFRQLELQYALAPVILDNRLEAIPRARWVIGYFENEELHFLPGALASVLGLEVETICGNYVLFRRAG
jgi:hypothetical protein